MNGQPPVTVYWRPGCGFCRILRRELDRVGVERSEINIWEDPAAAAVVRLHAQGNETVPTVLIGGDLALVNPTAAEVLASCERTAGSSVPAGPPVQARGPLATPSPWPGLAWTLTACVVWAGFALANPTTTYHLAPVVALLSWPVIDRGHRPRDGWLPGVLAAAGATILVVVTTLLLVSREALAGPALVGPNANAETFALTSTAAVVAFMVAQPRRGGLARRDRPADAQTSRDTAASTSPSGG